MARIIKRDVTRGKRYEVRWSWPDEVTGRRRFAQERFATLQEAKAKKADVEKGASDGTLQDPAPARATFAEWAELWFRDHSTGLKPSTARSYRALLDKSVLPRFGTRSLRAIATADVQDFVHDLQDQGLTPPTIRHHYLTARLVFTYAVQRRALAYNPALDVKLPTDKSTGRAKPSMSALTEQQVAALVGHLDPPYDLLVLFMAYTGLRCGEVSGLNVGDLDLAARTVTVRRTRRKIKASETHPDGWEVHVPKNGKGRVVGLPGWLVADLRTYLAAHPCSGDADAPLWPGRKNGGAERFTGGKGGLDYAVPWTRDAFYKRQF